MNLDELILDIQARVKAMDEKYAASFDEAKLRGMIQNMLNTDPQFARKMRFDGQPEPKLAGSKFARWNLTVQDIELLYDLQVSLRGQRKPDGDGIFKGPSDELENAFKAVSGAFYMSEEEARELDKRAIDAEFKNGRYPKPWHRKGDYERALAAIGIRTADSGAAGAMDTADSGYGASLIGAQYIADLWAGARSESRIFNLLDSVEMQAPVVYVPVDAALPEMFYLAENTVRDPSDYAPVKTGSNRVTLTAYKFGIPQTWSTEMEEDSILPFLPYLRRQAQLSIAHYLDSVVLNGDTTTGGAQLNTSSDPAGTGKHWLAFDGMRHVGLVDNTNNQKDMSGAITFTALLNAKGRMVDTTYQMDWGHPVSPTDLVYACDPFTGDKIVDLDEVKAWRTYGQKPLLNGQVAEVLGHPVIPTIAIAKSLATGLVHASTGNDYGTVVTFNRRAFKVGWRRRVSVATLFKPGVDQTQILYSLRLGFGRFSPTGAASGIEGADVIFDISLA